MKLLALSILLLLPVSAQAYIMPNFEPKDLEQADTILFVPLYSIKISVFPGQRVSILGPVKTAWDITAPLVLLGRAGPAERIAFTDYDYPYLANKTAELLFLRRNGQNLEPVGELGWAVGVSGDAASLATDLKGIKPDAWSLLAHCLIVEKDPACALHLSRILSVAPPDVLRTTWNAVANRRNEAPDLRLAYENIGLHVIGVSSLDGFIEPGVNKDQSPYDKDGSQMARYEIVGPMFTWLYYGHDTEDYHHLLAFARNQRGRVGEAAIRGTTNLTQKTDLPQLLDIFEHAPDIAIRYACLEDFYRILGRPYPSEIPGFDVFQKHEAKYVRIWKGRISDFTSS
jgi:hypothetical protein